MKAERILQEFEVLKERLATEAGRNTRRFLEQMEAWLDEHPHSGPVINSPEQLQVRLRTREATEPPPLPSQPYRVYDPIIAEIHRTRERLSSEPESSGKDLNCSTGSSRLAEIQRNAQRVQNPSIPRGDTRPRNIHTPKCADTVGQMRQDCN